MTIIEYAKLKPSEKETILRNESLLIDQYKIGKLEVLVYFFNGFFIEVTIQEGKIIDNLPYARGFKLDKKNIHNLEKRNAAL